jgi:hypothetical protein
MYSWGTDASAAILRTMQSSGRSPDRITPATVLPILLWHGRLGRGPLQHPVLGGARPSLTKPIRWGAEAHQAKDIESCCDPYKERARRRTT